MSYLRNVLHSVNKCGHTLHEIQKGSSSLILMFSFQKLHVYISFRNMHKLYSYLLHFEMLIKTDKLEVCVLEYAKMNDFRVQLDVPENI